MLGRTEDEIIDYYKKYKKLPPADDSMGYEYRGYNVKDIMRKIKDEVNN